MKKGMNEFKLLFEPFFEGVLNTLVSQAKKKGEPDSFVIITDQIKRLCMLSGAKRLRPFLVYLGYSLYKDISLVTSSELDSILQTGSGLEIFHTSALVYDDIIDQSDLRRGEPTIEAFYKEKYKTEKKKNYVHTAISATILAGIMSHSLADKQINKVDNLEVRDFYYEMQYELISGQTDDTLGVGTSDLDSLEVESIIKMMVAKSGNYSIQKPLLFGLKLAKCPDDSELYRTIELIGYKSGLLFQLVDDIIGLFESQEGIGKSNTTDILEGKRTLLIQKLYADSSPQNRLKIINILGNTSARGEDIEWVKNQIVESGTLEYYNKYAKNLAEESLALTSSLLKVANNEGLETLDSLIAYLISRTK